VYGFAQNIPQAQKSFWTHPIEHDEDIIGSKMTMPTTSIPKVQPFYMRLIIDAFDAAP
jgi:hypothetical protein